jgi:hypothetical protein
MRMTAEDVREPLRLLVGGRRLRRRIPVSS